MATITLLQLVLRRGRGGVVDAVAAEPGEGGGSMSGGVAGNRGGGEGLEEGGGEERGKERGEWGGGGGHGCGVVCFSMVGCLGILLVAAMWFACVYWSNLNLKFWEVSLTPHEN
jgi:hypothetical protein